MDVPLRRLKMLQTPKVKNISSVTMQYRRSHYSKNTSIGKKGDTSPPPLESKRFGLALQPVCPLTLTTSSTAINPARPTIRWRNCDIAERTLRWVYKDAAERAVFKYESLVRVNDLAIRIHAVAVNHLVFVQPSMSVERDRDRVREGARTSKVIGRRIARGSR